MTTPFDSIPDGPPRIKVPPFPSIPTFSPADASWIGENTAATPKVDTYCAFCLETRLPAQQVRRCSQCHRRAYCSKECQLKDWSPKNKENGPVTVGQGHKSWCCVPYGELDLDWEVVPVPGRGHGIVAKRFIPANSRIIVDGFKTDYLEAQRKGKNILEVSKEGLGDLSRLANHECDPNASLMADPDFKTTILYANRDIFPGQEICTSYMLYNDSYQIIPNPYEKGKWIESFADCRRILESRHQIVCPHDCFCRNEEIEKLLKYGQMLYSFILDGSPNLNATKMTPKNRALRDLQIIGNLLQMQPQVHVSAIQKAILLYQGFGVAVQQEMTLEWAQKAINEAHLIWSSILHPRCRMATMDTEYATDLTMSAKYLQLEQQNEE